MAVRLVFNPSLRYTVLLQSVVDELLSLSGRSNARGDGLRIMSACLEHDVGADRWVAL